MSRLLHPLLGSNIAFKARKKHQGKVSTKSVSSVRILILRSETDKADQTAALPEENSTREENRLGTFQRENSLKLAFPVLGILSLTRNPVKEGRERRE